jgi:hypothetical protein
MTDNDIVSIIEELLEKIVDSSNKEETKLYGIEWSSGDRVVLIISRLQV